MLRRILYHSGLARDRDWARFVFRWLAVGLCLHLVAVCLSTGFFHTDEHFQILEFLNYKLGRSSAADLPIEFREQMRPWLQTAIFYVMTRAWSALGVVSPFAWAWSFRFLSAILGWASGAGLALCAWKWIPERRWREVAVIGLTVLWYLPALHARPSSESLGGSCFLLGLTLLYLTADERGRFSRLPCLASGLLFGLAFEFRYQIGVMIVGFVLWLLFIYPEGFRERVRAMCALSAGVAIALLLGALADRWGYGDWAVAPWNYVRFNLIEGHVSEVDHPPWWDYFRRALTETWPPLGLLLLASFPVAWIRHPKHVLTWSLFPLFLTHEMIGHKELRFLFPIALAGPVFLVQAFYSEKSGRLDFARLVSFRIFRWLAQALIALNLLALLVTTTVPAWMPIRFYAKVYDLNSRILGGMTLYYKGDNPYHVLGITLNFYQPDDLKLAPIASYDEIRHKLDEGAGPIWFYSTGLKLPPDAASLASVCHAEFHTLPEFVKAITDRVPYFGIRERISGWTLYQCHLENHHPK